MLDAAIAPLAGSAIAGFAFKPRYDNFINGKFTAPLGGQYFDNKATAMTDHLVTLPVTLGIRFRF